jgi:hypothetical protein
VVASNHRRQRPRPPHRPRHRELAVERGSGSPHPGMPTIWCSRPCRGAGIRV